MEIVNVYTSEFFLQLQEQQAKAALRPISEISTCSTTSQSTVTSSETETDESDESSSEEEKKKKKWPKHPRGYTPLREPGWYYKQNRRRRPPRKSINKIQKVDEEEEEEEEDSDFEPVAFNVPRAPPPSRCTSSDEDTRITFSIVPTVVQYRDIERLETAKHAVRDPKWYYGKHKYPIHVRSHDKPVVIKNANDSDVEITNSTSSSETDPEDPTNSPSEGTPDYRDAPIVLGAVKQIDRIRQNPRYYYSQSVKRHRKYLRESTTSDSEDSDEGSIYDEAKIIMSDKTKDNATKWQEIQKRVSLRYKNDDGMKWKVVMRLREMMTYKLSTKFKRWWDEEIERKNRENMLTNNKRVTLAEKITLQRRVSKIK